MMISPERLASEIGLAAAADVAIDAGADVAVGSAPEHAMATVSTNISAGKAAKQSRAHREDDCRVKTRSPSLNNVFGAWEAIAPQFARNPCFNTGFSDS